MCPRPIGFEDWLWPQQRSCRAGAKPPEQDSLQRGSGAQRVCPFSVSFVEVVGWFSSVVWSCPLGVLALGPPGTRRPRPTAACALPRATQHELQSDLQGAPAVLASEGPRRGRAANQGRLLLVRGLGPLSKRYRAHWGQMLPVWSLWTLEILGNSPAWAKTGHLYEEATGSSMGGPQSRCGGVPGNHQSRAKSVS